MSETVFTLSRGFLPTTDPLKQLPKAFSEWETIAAQLPKLLMTDQCRNRISSLPDFPIHQLKSSAEHERAMLILSFLGHAFVWGALPHATQIPSNLAKPWCELGNILQRPAVLSYASYALHNWYRLDPKRPVELGNIALLQNFFGGMDEEWFILIHIDIEAKIAPALQILLSAQDAAANNDLKQLLNDVLKIKTGLFAICETLDRMPEKCDPYIYYNRVRPYIHGWKNNPALPNGLIYDGVDHNQPKFFRGETGAQSTIIPSMDAVLGITHETDDLRVYLQEMRDYMPDEHRAFLSKLEQNKSIRDCVIKHQESHLDLREAYNTCVDLIVRFRMTHLKYAATYIHQQSQHVDNSTAVGTGGTPFMRYLKKHEVESERFKI